MDNKSVDNEKVNAFLNMLENYNILDSEFLKLYELFNRLTPMDKFRFEQTYCEEYDCEHYEECMEIYNREEDSEVLSQFLKILRNSDLTFESSCQLFFIFETQLNPSEKRQVLFNAFKNGRASMMIIFYNGKAFG